ncbi:vWA domain-containing protein [Micromonospora sp. CPCC 206061]|uniref:vWA domain-containing protein n=1 Tax=Micromonospora sp. CPCC 206061 TaxID=3122410 RepID=UPI002FF0BB23
MSESAYAVDIVFCIDVTGSMSPVIDTVKKGALSFHKRLVDAMSAREKAVGQLRIRVVAYRDFEADPGNPVELSDFWRIPEQAKQFEKFVKGLRADGGGDVPESGLEALALAINSPWEREFERRRHVIVMFTDAPAHDLGVGSGTRQYPPDMPNDLDELAAMWGRGRSNSAVMDSGAKRLLIFAPDLRPWTTIADSWSNTLHSASNAGTGLRDVDLDEVIGTIAGSV